MNLYFVCEFVGNWESINTKLKCLKRCSTNTKRVVLRLYSEIGNLIDKYDICRFLDQCTMENHLRFIIATTIATTDTFDKYNNAIM